MVQHFCRFSVNQCEKLDMLRTNELYTKKIYNFLSKLLSVYGFWLPFDGSKFVFVLLRIWGGILYIFLLIFTFFLLASIFVNTENDKLTKRLFMSATKFAMTAKMLPLYFLNRKVQQIRYSIESFRLQSMDEEHKVEKYVNRIAIVIYILHSLPQIAIFAWNTEAFLAAEHKLVYSGWYPGINWQENDQAYHYVMAYQVIVISVTGFINMACDSYFGLAMYMISIEFELLGDRLEAMQDISTSPKTKQQLVESIKTLQDIRQISEDVKDTLAWSYFVQVIMSSIVIGSTVNELARVCDFDLSLFISKYFISSECSLTSKNFCSRMA